MADINNNKFDDDEADAILQTGEHDINEELDSLGGFQEYLQDCKRLGGEDSILYRE